MPTRAIPTRAFRWPCVAAAVSAAFVLVGACEAGAVELSPKARELFEREVAAHRRAQSAHGKIASLWEVKLKDLPPYSSETVTEFAVQRPAMLRIKTKDITAISDGVTLTLRSESLGQYLQRPCPKVSELGALIKDLSAGSVRNIPMESLLRPDPLEFPLEMTMSSMRRYDSAQPGESEGVKGVWVTGKGFDERSEQGTPDFDVKRFVEGESGMTTLLIQDLTSVYNATAQKKHQEDLRDDPDAPQPREYEKAAWTVRFTRELDAPLPPDTFTFTPSKTDRKVESFIFKRPGLVEQVSMIGKPLPSFSAVDLDGARVDLAAMKGKVIVLDFWATWCGPCVQGLPSMQAIEQKYKDRGLVMLGVNRDASGKTGKVKEFLKRKGITIPQIDDAKASIADTFFVKSIPCVVFVDRSGIVQEIDVGYLPGKETQTAEIIEKLLEGKPLRTQQQLQELREQVGAEKAKPD